MTSEDHRLLVEPACCGPVLIGCILCDVRGPPSAGGAGLWRGAGSAVLGPAPGGGGVPARPAGGGGLRGERRDAPDADPVAADDERLRGASERRQETGQRRPDVIVPGLE